MDPLANFTALYPHDHDRSTDSRLGESQEVSQQCSADPNAFLGLRHPSVIVTGNHTRMRGELRLTLDVGGSVSQLSQQTSQPYSQVNELFLEDTQHDDDDEEEQAVVEIEAETKEEAVRTDEHAASNRESGFLVGVERHLQTSGGYQPEVDQGEKKALDLSTGEDNSEQTEVVVGDAMDADMEEDESIVSGEEDPERTPVREDLEDEALAMDEDQVSEGSIAATEQLEDEDQDEDADYDADDIGATEVFPDTLESTEVLPDSVEYGGTYPWKQSSLKPFSRERNTSDDSVAMVDDQLGNTKQAREEHPTLDDTVVSTEDQTLVELAERVRRERAEAMNKTANSVEDSASSEDVTLAEIALRIREARGQKGNESEVLGPQSTWSGTSTPPLRPGPVRYAHSTTNSQESDSQEVLTPTQPSKATETVALKKREKTTGAISSVAHERPFEFVGSQSACHCGETQCQCSSTTEPLHPVKAFVRPSPAIRNLQFSFAIPESQESESQLPDSLPDLGALAFKALRSVERTDDSSHKVEHPGTAGRVKRNDKQDPVSETDSTPRKKAKTTSVVSSPSHPSTPTTNRKRARAFLSPDAGTDAHNQVTPPKARQQTRSSSQSPSQTTPSVRTRARILSPVPSTASRKSSSRSRSLFKSKYDFCITGFMGEGEAALTKLIEDYGGRVHSQIIDVLQQKPPNKAVVIATPVSWRKLKFMYAVAAGIPVVHPEWIHACARQGNVVPFEGFCVPSGYSVTTSKFECVRNPNLNLFEGLRVGIPRSSGSSDSVNPLSELVAFILRSYGAESVDEALVQSRERIPDVIVTDEYSKICEYYATKHKIPIKSFAWVTECMILQRLVPPTTDNFVPERQIKGDAKRGIETVNAVTAQIGDGDSSDSRTTLKLYTGELVLVDLGNKGVDHFLLFEVCEILSIHVLPQRSKRRNEDGSVQRTIQLHVGVLERYPYSPKLHRRHVQVLDLSPEKIKRRVVAVSKADFDSMKYRDESVFYYED